MQAVQISYEERVALHRANCARIASSRIAYLESLSRLTAKQTAQLARERETLARCS